MVVWEENMEVAMEAWEVAMEAWEVDMVWKMEQMDLAWV